MCRYVGRTCVTKGTKTSAFVFCVLLSCVQVLSGASVGDANGCGEVWGVLERRFNVSDGGSGVGSSQLLESGVGGGGGE